MNQKKEKKTTNPPPLNTSTGGSGANITQSSGTNQLNTFAQ